MSETEFVVMTASAKVPAALRRYGRYIRVAVCEVAKGTRPAMISTRAKGMVRIVHDSGPVHLGKTSRCAAQRAIEEANAMAERLNRQK